MKRIILGFFLLISAVNVAFSEDVEWDVYEVGGGNLQKMNVIDENTAFIAGYDYNFLQSNNAGESWENIPILKSKSKFLDFSFVGDTGYVIGNRSLLIDHESKTGYPDVYSDGVLLKFVAGDWTVISTQNIGSGDDATTNPNTPGCGQIDLVTVETINQSVAYIGVRWNNYNSGEKVVQSAVFKTMDGGETWSNILDAQGLFLTSIVFKNNTGYIAGLKFFAKTTNGGLTFVDLFPELEKVADDNIYIQDITTISDDEIYLTTTSDGILHSTDGGANILKVSTIAGGNDFLKLDEQTYVIAGTSSKAKVTTDGGTTWESFGPGYTAYEIYGPWNDSIYFLGKTNMAVISVADVKNLNADGFTTREMSSGNNLNKFHAFNNDEAIIGANSGELIETRDGGKNWNLIDIPELPVLGAEFDFIALSTSKSGSGYLTARNLKYIDFHKDSPYTDMYHPGVIFKTTDAWNSWEVFNAKLVGVQYTEASQNPSLEGCYRFEAYSLLSIDANNAIMYGTWKDSITVQGSETAHGRIFHTSDGGTTWNTITDDLGSSFVNTIEGIGDVVFSGGNKTFLKYTISNQTTTDLYPVLAGISDGSMFINDIEIINESEFFVTTSADSVFHTTDGGVTYNKLDDIKGANDFIALNDRTYFVCGTAAKTKFSNDFGETWNSASTESTLYEIGPIWNNRVFALAKGAIYSADLISFGVDDAVGDVLAGSSNPLRVISHASVLEVYSNGGEIEQCFVYNSLGQQVASMQPNATNFQINSTQFDSGVYIVIAKSGNEKLTTKVIVK